MDTMTFSALAALRKCPKCYQLRYLDQLVPIETPRALSFGRVFHEVLEHHYRGLSADALRDRIDAAFPDRIADGDQRQQWHVMHAILTGYLSRYSQEPFHPVYLEYQFDQPLVNPQTNCPSRTFRLQGKVDGIVQMHGAWWVLEHKTTSTLTGDYIERLPLDTQISMYVLAVEAALDLKVAGVLYNVVVKKRLVQARGESDVEYAERVAASKTGKIKRKEAESDEAYRDRLEEAYLNEPLFHREEVLLDRAHLDLVRRETWADARRARTLELAGFFPRNTGSCHSPYPCQFARLCQAHEAHHIRDMHFKTQQPHEELADLAF